MLPVSWVSVLALVSSMSLAHEGVGDMSVLVMVIHMVSIHGHTRDHVEEGDAHEYEGGHSVEVVSVRDATVPDGRQDQPEEREH